MQCTNYVPKDFAEELKQTAQTGMGYQIVSVTLKDGTTFDQVAISEGCFIEVRGYDDIPFVSADVAAVKVNHRRWNFRNRVDVRLKARTAAA